MSWSLYRWTWQLDSPLYVGATPAGSLNRCRLYIPARTFWAALTAELARHGNLQNTNSFPNYEEIGDQLQQDCRFTYLYPAQEVKGKWKAWLPRYELCEGLTWQREDHDSPSGAMSNRDFRLRLLHTRASTAIDPLTDTAAEGSLRETECVQTRWRDEAGCDMGPVAFVGYVLAQGHGQVIDQLLPIDVLFIGGDTRYGLGRLRRIDTQRADRIFNQSVALGENDPEFQGTIALAHTKTSANMIGARELLAGWNVGRRWSIAESGAPLWVPGSQLDKQISAAAFRINKTGIWCLE